MLSSLVAGIALAGVWPVNVAEASGYHKTSSYEDVVSFITQLEKAGAPIENRWIGKSTEGRKIPLVIVSDPPVHTAQEARAKGKLVVYIQANIHAGEVEGKEAALIMLRRIAQDKAAGKPTLLKDMVLLVNPIYNADGNEKWGPVAKNRPEQDGPDIVGLRANGQNFDLNRDCIKAESPEMKAALESVYTKWDPDVVMDLHTTDGTRHGYELTYSPPLNPSTPNEVRTYSQDVLLPAVRADLKANKGILTFDYGNAEGTAWRTFGQEGRYVTNYAGLCNRIGILSEATTFI
ncbi:MAG: M14 family zinc carboxypeptidase, partial [Armatimonadota bacterium]